MKKVNVLIAFLILVSLNSYGQENSQEITKEQYRLEDLARSAYYENGGKLLFHDIYGQQERWQLFTTSSVADLESILEDLRQVKKKWEAPNGPMELQLSRIDAFHSYNDKICSTYGAVETPNSDHIMDWCKVRDEYKNHLPRESNHYKMAMGFWQQKYDTTLELLNEKNSSSNQNTSSTSETNNSNSETGTDKRNNQGGLSDSNSSTNNNLSGGGINNIGETTSSGNQETAAERAARIDRERGAEIMQETQQKVAAVKQTSAGVVDAVAPLASGIASGISDGTIESVRLIYGTRSFNEETQGGTEASDVLFADSYELGINFGKGGFSFGAAFSDVALAYVVGINYDAFSGLVKVGDINFISVGFNAEVGFGNSDQEPIVRDFGSNIPGSTESLTYYSPGVYVMMINDILYFSYNYGWTSGEETIFFSDGAETRSLKGTYNKIGFGINIKF